MTEVLLEARDIEVQFASRGVVARALDGVSLEWRRGEILGVVGESGCGKSTLARTLLGLQPSVAGSVALDGTPVDDRQAKSALRRRVQMIFQDPYQTLNPRQRVEAIVSEPLIVQNVERSERAERVRRALDDVGLDPERYLERYPHQLSGGQRQRVAIAAALVLEPDGLICDEPVSMLDASVRAQILAVLLELQRRRELGLLFITHDLSLAWSLCDRLAVMYLGRVVEQGSAVDVIERPQHPYTQALVDAVPVPAAGGGGRARAARRRAARRHRLAIRLPLPPALSAALRAVRLESTRHCWPRARPTSSPPACFTTPIRLRRQNRPPMAERWREIAGPVGLLEPGPPQRDHRRPRSPGRPRAGRQRRAHRGDRRRPAVAPGAPAPRRSTGWASSPAWIEIDERGSIETPGVPVRHARGRHRPPAPRSAHRGAGPDDIVLPVVGECDDSDMRRLARR